MDVEIGFKASCACKGSTIGRPHVSRTSERQRNELLREIQRGAAHFIHDVRADFGAPKMPFVIGLMGVGGVNEGQVGFYLHSKHKDHANADGHMTDAEKREYLAKHEADLITPAEAALWKRGASNAGYHYLGCAKTFALMGRAFAEANLALRRAQRGK